MIHNVTTMSHNSIAIQDAPTEDYNHGDFYFEDYNYYYDASTEDNNDS